MVEGVAVSRRSGHKCATRGCRTRTDTILCVDCAVALALETGNPFMIPVLLHRIPPKRTPKQIAAEDAAAKARRRKFRLVK